jgi:hypothetical protein
MIAASSSAKDRRRDSIGGESSLDGRGAQLTIYHQNQTQAKTPVW